MKVLVIGGSGFLGSHVADALSEEGHDVTIFSRHESEYLRSTQKMVVGDILDQVALEKAAEGCDVIYNFAAMADMDECRKKPVETVKYNILGNVLALEAARKVNARRFIFASSVYVYSNTGSFYKSSKQACESFIEEYNKLFGLPYTILRYGTLYGRRAGPNNAVFRMLKDALEKGKIEYGGTGEEVREYIHVKDAAKLSVEVLKPEYENKCLTLTGTQKIKNKELLEMINEMLDNKIKIIYSSPKSPIHYKITPYSFSSKIGEKLTANPHVDMGQGLLDCMREIHEKLNSRK
jgi:UDP-glucose 4-epimerase